MSAFNIGGGVYLLGMSDVAWLGSTRFWAERGLIHWEDSLTETYSSMSVEDARLRVTKIMQMLGTTTKDGIEKDENERRQKIKFIEDMHYIMHKAEEQGMPSDPTCYHNYEIKRPKTFVMKGRP